MYYNTLLYKDFGEKCKNSAKNKNLVQKSYINSRISAEIIHYFQDLWISLVEPH
jgi:hypothetical protein